MTRRLLDVLALLSFLLFVVFATTWVRARVSWDLVHVNLPRHVAYASTDRNGVAFGWWRRDEHDPLASAVQHESLPAADRDRVWRGFTEPTVRWRFAGFYLTRANQRPLTAHSVGVPMWFLLLATGIAPAVRGPRHLRRRLRRRRGACPRCGYDLRATPLRCPECGWAAPRPA